MEGEGLGVRRCWNAHSTSFSLQTFRNFNVSEETNISVVIVHQKAVKEVKFEASNVPNASSFP